MITKRFLTYFQNEMAYLKRKGQKFAKQYPRTAQHLGMTGEQIEDPHVERIIESFAFLTAGIQQRLDEDMPEVARELLSVLAPQFLKVFPSVCIVQFQPDTRNSGISGENEIPQGAALYSSRDENGERCQFTTLRDTALSLWQVSEAEMGLTKTQQYRLKLTMNSRGKEFPVGKRFRFYLNGEPSLVELIYTLLCMSVVSIRIITSAREYWLPPSSVGPVVLQERENISETEFAGKEYTLILDYFFFREKFYFIDINLEDAGLPAEVDSFLIEIVFKQGNFVSQLTNFLHLINASLFCLNCTPALNLYSTISEPAEVFPGTVEYAVVPDIRHSSRVQVWSITGVSLLRECEGQLIRTRLPHLYRSAHDTFDNSLFWQEVLRTYQFAEQQNYDYFVALAETGNDNGIKLNDIISMDIQCTDGEYPAELVTGRTDGDFECDLPFTGIRICALKKPSFPVYFPDKSKDLWRLVSHLSLNNMILNQADAVTALKKALLLYNFTENAEVVHRISLIKDVTSRPVYERLDRYNPCSYARGTEITVMFHSQAKDDTGFYLLCRIISFFLGNKVPVNSFFQVITCVDEVPELTIKWPLQTTRLLWL